MSEEVNKEDEKANLMEGLSLTKVSDIVESLIAKEDMKELKILKDRIIKYKEELETKIKDNKIIEHESFKKNLFRNLEKNLFIAIYIRDPHTRQEKIRKTYLWFFDKIQKWNSLDKIKYRTDKDVDEQYKPEEIARDDIIIKDDEYELKEFHLHRSDIPGLEPPRQRLAEYKTKQVKPPARFKKDKTTMDNLRFNINRFHGRVGSACNMIQMKPSQFYQKTGKLWFNPTNIPVTVDYTPIEVRKEIKSAYSFNRPDYQLSQLKLEKKIMEAKNIEIREKRNKEEIKKMMDEAAIVKAKYKEKREKKFNIDNIVKEYQRTFKVDKNAEQLIHEQKQLEKNNNDLKIREFKKANRNYAKGGFCYKKINLTYDDNESNSKINDGLSNDNKNIKNIKSNKNSNDNIELNKISSKFPNCYSNINNKIIYSNIENKNELINKNEKKQNMDNNSNINNNNNNVTNNMNLNTNETKKDNQDNQDNNYKLSLKANKEELFKKIKIEQNKTAKIKYDTVALNLVNDRVLKTRIQSAKMCDVKEIAPKKMDYIQYYTPLSAFDELNYKTYTGKFIQPKPKNARPRTASEFAFRNYKKYESNYLALRKEMSKYYDQEIESMNKLLYTKIDEPTTINEKEKTKISETQSKKPLPNIGKVKPVGRAMSPVISERKEGLLINRTYDQLFERPLEGPPRPMYYLPKPELGLLKKPPGMKAKKKKKGKKKKH